MKKLYILVTLSLVFVLSGCQNYDKYWVTASVPVTGIEVVKDVYPVELGKMVKLTAHVKPANATFRKVSWKIEEGKDGLAVVDADTGLVTIKAGVESNKGKTFKVYASITESGRTYSDETQVRIQQDPPIKRAQVIKVIPQPSYVSVETSGALVGKSVVGLHPSEAVTFATKILPEDAEPETAHFQMRVTDLEGEELTDHLITVDGTTGKVVATSTTSEDDRYAKIIVELLDAEGGNALDPAMYPDKKDGDEYIVKVRDEYIVKVLAPVKPETLSLSEEEFSVKSNSVAYIIPSFAPQNTADKTFAVSYCAADKFVESTVTCSEPLNATQAKMELSSQGKLTINDVTPGTSWYVIVTSNAKDKNKQQLHAFTKINVALGEIPIENIKFTRQQALLSTADEDFKTDTIRPKFIPENTTQRNLKWSVTAGEGVVKVDENGNVTALTAGDATIQASSIENPSIKATMQFKVLEKYKYIEHMQMLPQILASGTISTDEKPVIKELNVEINDGVTFNDITYFSTNDKVVSVEKCTNTAPDGAVIECTDEQKLKPKVKINGYGTAEIYAVSQRGGKSESTKVSVININPAAGADGINPELPLSCKDIVDPDATKCVLFNITADDEVTAKQTIYAKRDQLQLARSVHRLKLNIKPDTGVPASEPKLEVGQTLISYKLWEAVYAWATTEDPKNHGKRLMDGGPIYKFKVRGDMGNYGVTASGPNIYYENDLQPVAAVRWRDAVVWCNAYTEWLNYTNTDKPFAELNYEGTKIYKPVYLDQATDEVLRDSTGDQADGAHPVDNAKADLTKNGIRLLTKAERLKVGSASILGIEVTNNEAYLKKHAWITETTIGDNKPWTRPVGTITGEVVKDNGTYIYQEDINTCTNSIKICDIAGNLFEILNDRYDSNTKTYYIAGSYFYKYNAGVQSNSTAQGNLPLGSNVWPDLSFRIGRTITTDDPE